MAAWGWCDICRGELDKEEYYTYEDKYDDYYFCWWCIRLNRKRW